MGKAASAKAPMKDGSRIEKSIFARVAKDGRITAYQVKMHARGAEHAICESFDSMPEARSYRDSVRADLALDPYKARVLKARVEAHAASRVAGLSLANLLQRYLDEVTPKKRGAVNEGYVVRKVMRYQIAKLPAIGLTTHSVRTFAQALLSEGTGKVTVSKYLSVVSSCLKWARGALDYPIPNPVLDLPAKERRTNSVGRERRLAPTEERYLRTAMTELGHEYLQALFDLALETGARRSELLDLRWRDVDLEGRVAVARETKNGRDRPLLLSTKAVETLLVLKARPVRGLDGRIVRMTPMNLDHRWTTARARALRAYARDCAANREKVDKGFLADLRWHDLRHEAISRVAEGGALTNTQQMQVYSGHTDARMVQRYTHIRTFQELARRLG